MHIRAFSTSIHYSKFISFFLFQVNDFLSGKAPLNLTMRLGDHMMLIQLQLSTISPSTSRRSATASSSSSSSTSSPKKSSCKVHPPPSLDIPIETAAMATAATLCTPQEPSSLKPSTSSVLDTATSSSLTSSVPLCKNVPCKCSSPATTTSASSKPLLDTRALAEASRNLTQTLKQLSSEVLTSKSDPKDVSNFKGLMDSYNVVELFHYFKILFLKIAPTHSSSDNSATLIVPPSDAFIAFMQSKSLFFHFQNPITSSYNIKAHLDRQRNSVGYNDTTQTNYGIPILNGNANDERKKRLGDEFSAFFRPAFFSILFIC